MLSGPQNMGRPLATQWVAPTGVGMAQFLVARYATPHSQEFRSRRLICSPSLEEWGSLHGMEL